jgi:endoribonuclease Dicer
MRQSLCAHVGCVRKLAALSRRRTNSIDNQFLRKKAIKLNLGEHILASRFRSFKWIPPTSEECKVSNDGMLVTSFIPRRALSDCMESLLGASYLAGAARAGDLGGVSSALETGTRLGMCFGGGTPWHEREFQRGEPHAASVNHQSLEGILGYRFRNARLLLQAVTHRSSTFSKTQCYEREVCPLFCLDMDPAYSIN